MKKQISLSALLLLFSPQILLSSDRTGQQLYIQFIQASTKVTSKTKSPTQVEIKSPFDLNKQSQQQNSESKILRMWKQAEQEPGIDQWRQEQWQKGYEAEEIDAFIHHESGKIYTSEYINTQDPYNYDQYNYIKIRIARGKIYQSIGQCLPQEDLDLLKKTLTQNGCILRSRSQELTERVQYGKLIYSWNRDTAKNNKIASKISNTVTQYMSENIIKDTNDNKPRALTTTELDAMAQKIHDKVMKATQDIKNSQPGKHCK